MTETENIEEIHPESAETQGNEGSPLLFPKRIPNGMCLVWLVVKNVK